jgi:hypothetical protein
LKGESEYLESLAAYICTILPEDPKRQRRLLTAVARRVRPRMPRWVLGASVGFLAAVGGIVASTEMNARWDASPHARMAALPDGRVALKVITEARNGTVTVLWYKHITRQEARKLLTNPNWQDKIVAEYFKKPSLARGAVGLGS